MKNFEKYIDEIVYALDLLDCNYCDCNKNECRDCVMSKICEIIPKYHQKDMKQWLLQEYKEPIIVSHGEYVALKNLGSEFKFIARDKEENCLSAYTSKPYKGNVDWWLTGGVWCELLEHLFPFIKWEDEEPYEIAKLIEYYEKEHGDE